MKIIFNKIINNGFEVGFTSFDIEAKRIVRETYDRVANSIKDYYGIRKVNNRIEYYGYNYIATCSTTNMISYANTYIVVARFIERKQKYYLLIRADGVKLKSNEANTLLLNINGRLMNTVKSDKMIKLKTGSIPTYTKVNKNRASTSNDTVIKLHEVSDLRNRIHTPGVGRKFFGKHKTDTKNGVVKYSTVPNGYDNINEVVCYHLGKLFGVSICEASFEVYNNDRNWVLSVYEYDYKSEAILRCKDIFGTTDFHKRFSIKALEAMFGKQVVLDFNRMVVFDLLTHQVDRHIGNFAFFKDRMYPLYDNGRSLFWDIENLNEIPIEDVVNTFHTNEHGYGWSYLDSIVGMDECRNLIKRVTKEEIYNVLIKFYNRNRAVVLTNYIYNAYRIITGNR